MAVAVTGVVVGWWVCGVGGHRWGDDEEDGGRCCVVIPLLNLCPSLTRFRSLLLPFSLSRSVSFSMRALVEQLPPPHPRKAKSF